MNRALSPNVLGTSDTGVPREDPGGIAGPAVASRGDWEVLNGSDKFSLTTIRFLV
jgi:hypothetical protein